MDGTRSYGRRVGESYQKGDKSRAAPRDFTGFVFLRALRAVRAAVR